jgi:hypothetical protein
MYEKGCRGEDCFVAGNCVAAITPAGGPTGLSAALAEALVYCQDTKSCACVGSGTAPVAVSCGGTVCSPYLPPVPDPPIPACCTTGSDSSDVCGLDLSVQFAATCEALGQAGTPDNYCPSYSQPGFPYPPGTTLPGCCRADGMCGYWDDQWLGLGCVKPEMFGAETTMNCGGTTT